MAATLALVVLGGGCGFAERAATAERLTDAPARAETAAVAGTITVESRFRHGPPGAVATAVGIPGLRAGAGGPGAGGSPAPGRGEGAGPVTLARGRARFMLDLGRSQAVLVRDGSERPFVVVDDLTFYGRRAGVPDDDARPWIRLDLADVADGAGRANPVEVGADALAAVHPAVVTDLAAGLLAGSIRRVGREELGGVPTTAYRANIGINKALTKTRRARYPEDRLEQVRDLLDKLGVSGDVHPARVWLDDEGRLRRFEVELLQHPLAKVEFGLRITVDYEAYGVPFTPQVPDARQLLTVDTLVRFIRTVSGGSAVEAGPGQAPGSASPGGGAPEGGP